jgi:hypothetical protein
MVGWTAGLLGLSALDALQVVSQAGFAPCGNVVDTVYTMVAKLPKAIFGAELAAYGGAHARLRAAAQKHRSAQ